MRMNMPHISFLFHSVAVERSLGKYLSFDEIAIEMEMGKKRRTKKKKRMKKKIRLIRNQTMKPGLQQVLALKIVLEEVKP